MQQTYTKNYLKIYSMQILSMILGFASMFIVIPYLSTDQTTYGIYAVCISITIFLSYADLGFLGVAQKYAAESYSRNDIKEEISFLGFAHFILLIVTVIIGGIFLYLSFHPEYLITDLQPGPQTETASRLLLILAFSTPIVVVQRLAQMIFGIRLQEYRVQQLVIAGNTLKIISVFYFFTITKYDIVGYYLFLQIISAIVALGALYLARQKFRYPLRLVISCFRFSFPIFKRTRSLAFSSLFVTLCWVLYYELDSVAIAKLLGADAVAIYVIGLSILSFVRSLLGVLFSPFSARFNHFVGLGKQTEFRNFYFHVIRLTFPLVVFPLVALTMMSQGVVISWVGNDYVASVEVVRWLVLCNILGFVSYPAGLMLVACEKIGKMYFQSILIVIIFWGGIGFTIGNWGVEAFARFKFLAFTINGIVYILFSLRFLEISLKQFVRAVIIPYLPGLIVMTIALFFVRDSCISGKDKLNLLINGCLILGGTATGIIISLITAPEFRQYVIKILRVIRN